ncbi:MAG: hypothetical protein EPO51_19305 [Phenylobacterium sp.]|uniref:hypothetical protein n=1 Tax=Phenylobacterium sp. TaxID=1871053 RepID=UPI001220C33D|nr:hypothetical protein [Phenylobacterium sp.]TAJ70241.1 MAG: hypothetical protein EPO51_19305 [Phenylobacterium sp.]
MEISVLASAEQTARRGARRVAADRIARVAAMPLAATGKIDKVRLRADYVDGKIPAEDVVR